MEESIREMQGSSQCKTKGDTEEDLAQETLKSRVWIDKMAHTFSFNDEWTVTELMNTRKASTFHLDIL